MRFVNLILDAFRRDFFSSLALLVYNLSFVVGYLFFGWNVKEIIFLFSFEAVFFLIFIWIELMLLYWKKYGDMIAYTLVFMWQIIVVWGVTYEHYYEYFGLPELPASALHHAPIDAFRLVFTHMPHLIPVALILVVYLLVDLVKRYAFTKNITSIEVKRCNYFLFYMSLIHVYCLILVIAFFASFFNLFYLDSISLYGGLLLSLVILFKIISDFMVSKKEDEYYSHKGREELFFQGVYKKIVWGKEYYPGSFFFMVFWFCLSAFFIVPMYLFSVGYSVDFWIIVFGLFLISTYGVFTLLFLLAFFNAGKRSIFITHDGKVYMQGLFRSRTFVISEIEKVKINKGKDYGGYLHLFVTSKHSLEPVKFVADSFTPGDIKKILSEFKKVNKNIRLVGLDKLKK